MGSKLFTEEAIKEMILSEGWPLILFDLSKRSELATRLLEKLKVIEDRQTHRLECYNFAESRILAVVMMGGAPNKPDVPLGAVEINEHMTLTDLRTIISNELDRDIVPKAYRFMYKANPCAARQEGIRKAWETLPKVMLLAKVAMQVEASNDEKNAKKNDKEEQIRLLKSQRRLNKKLVPVPLLTLCRVQEGSGIVYTYHDIREMVHPGDVVRIGHVNARDYIVPYSDLPQTDNRPPRSFQIEPTFDMVQEEDTPFQGNSILMAGEAPVLYTTTVDRKRASFISLGRAVSNSDDSFLLSGLDDFAGSFRRTSFDEPKGSGRPGDADAENGSRGQTRTTSFDEGIKPQRPLGSVVQGNVWNDMWIWRCIPRSQDRRPKWRQMYDDGLIPYEFTFQSRIDGPTYFRVPVQWRTVESFCRDARCPDLSLYRQRVQEMEGMTNDYYTDLVFKQMCSWYPQLAEFIDVNKFMKLMRDVKLFPDIKRPARTGQLEQIFSREVKTFGLAERYATYAGFCRVLQQIALIRFPYRVESVSEGSTKGKRKPKAADNSASKSAGESPPKKEATEDKKSSPSSVSGNRKRSPIRNKLKSMNGTDSTAEIDPAHISYAYNKLVVDYLMLVPEWSVIVWSDAKMSAMTKEAIRYAAATRIAAIWRGARMHYYFSVYLRCLTRLQSHVRRRQRSAKTARLLNQLVEDWLFRKRYHCASSVQAAVRRYIMRCRYLKLVSAVRERQVAITTANRQARGKINAKIRRGILFKEIRSVNGVMTVLQIHRKDQRNYSKDFGVVLEVYIPRNVKAFKFVIEEANLRQYMQGVLQVPAVSAGDLLDRRNLEKIVSSRLICRGSRRPDKPPKVLFSNQPLGQRGAKVMSHGIRIGKEDFVISLFETGSDITAQCYHLSLIHI